MGRGEMEAGTLATVSEASTATEVVMPLETLQVLVKIRGVCTGRRWDLLTTGRARGCSERAHLLDVPSRQSCRVHLERLDDLMRRYTQRGDAQSGQRHTLARTSEWRRWRHLFLNSSNDTANFTGRGWTRYQKLRGEVVLYAEARGIRGTNTIGQSERHSFWRKTWTVLVCSITSKSLLRNQTM